jgi:hypothetical protein
MANVLHAEVAGESNHVPQSTGAVGHRTGKPSPLEGEGGTGMRFTPGIREGLGGTDRSTYQGMTKRCAWSPWPRRSRRTSLRLLGSSSAANWCASTCTSAISPWRFPRRHAGVNARNPVSTHDPHHPRSRRGSTFPSAAASAIADRLVHRGILVRIAGKSRRSDHEIGG